MHNYLLSGAAAIAITTVSQAATVTWTGATNTDFDTASNWDTNTVPVTGDEVIIGDNQTVVESGRFVTTNGFTIGSGSTFNHGIGDYNNTYNIDGQLLQTRDNAVGLNGNATFNLGVDGIVDATLSSDNINFYLNNRTLTLNVELDLASAPAGTLVTRDLVIWDGFTRGATVAAVDSFSEVNGRTFTQLADNTAPVNNGEISFFFNLNASTDATNGFRVQYMAIPEPSSTALLGLGGLALIIRRKK